MAGVVGAAAVAVAVAVAAVVTTPVTKERRSFARVCLLDHCNSI
jgi:hypothetical protein